MSDLYTGAMGMISNMVKLNTHSNNIANASSNGYKYDQESFRVFEETYMRAKKQGSNDRIGEYYHEVYVDNIRTNFAPGSMLSSSNPLDLALHDSNSEEQTSFFVIGKEGNTYLTRNGGFVLDANRHISTANGGQLLDEQNRPITIPDGVPYAVRGDGMVINGETNEPIAKIQIRTVDANDLGLLKKEYGGYFSVRTYDDLVKNFGSIQNIIDDFDHNITLQQVFKTKERLVNIRDTGQVLITEPFSGSVRQNSLEISNVDMSKEMVGIIEAQKGVQFGQKVFNSMDKVLEKAANDVGK